MAITRKEGFQRTIFQSDCLSVIQRLNASTIDQSHVGLIIAVIRLSRWNGLLARSCKSLVECGGTHHVDPLVTLYFM